jgi:hypothetical protein
MRLRSTFATLFGISLAVMPVVLLMGSVEGLAACTVVAGLCYSLRDYFSPEQDSVNVMTCYAAFASLWFGVGNLVGYLLDGDQYPQFHVYDVPEYLLEAQVLATLGTVVPLLTFDACERHRARVSRRSPSQFGFEVSDRDLLRFCVGLLAITFSSQLLGIQFDFLGTLASLIYLGAVLVIFIISSQWQSPRATSLPRWTKWLAIALMVYQVGIALLFSNMRNNLVWPVAAYFLPFVLRKRLTLARVAGGVALVLCFAYVFQAIGEVRTQLFGEERLAYILDRPSGTGARDESGDATGLVSLAARLSTFNQLTQVVRIVEDEGLMEGETISYALYIFVPRAVWPDKPEVAPGQWFARKLGRGMDVGGSRFSNAINMTIPGELYLNFGWIGVLLGMVGVGALYHQYWQVAGYFRSDTNPIGLVFTYILINQAMFNGSHFAGAINLVLSFICLLAISWGLSLMFRRLRSEPSPTRASEQPEPQSAPL